jgi:hypothetical protein
LEPPGQRSHYGWIALIDVLPKYRFTPGIDAHDPIKQEHGDRMEKRHRHGFSRINGLQYLLTILLDVVVQQ